MIILYRTARRVDFLAKVAAGVVMTPAGASRAGRSVRQRANEMVVARLIDRGKADDVPYTMTALGWRTLTEWTNERPPRR